METQIIEPMLIVDYSADWAQQFNQLKKVLEIALSSIPTDIVHVGSTAVPGLPAKPIIDLDVIYNEASEFESIKLSLEKTGYLHHGNQGITGREVFKRKGTAQDEVLDGIAHHLYVCREDSDELRRHLIFKHCLLHNEVAKNFYGRLKRQLAVEAGEDRKVYAQLKEQKATAFINYLIEKANERNLYSQEVSKDRF
jgi:GrpB-like predicted nucleotidyltransferase (UPF0157 family)